MQKQKIILSVVALIVLAGIGYAVFKPESTDNAQKQTRRLSVHSSQDKQDYIQNLTTVSDEWLVLVGKLKEYRPNIALDKRESYDSWVSTFETMIPNFKTKLEEFRATPLEQFLQAREVMNEEFTVVAETYRKIILDFNVNFEEQP